MPRGGGVKKLGSMGKKIKVRPFLVFFRGFLMESSIISFSELKNAIKIRIHPDLRAQSSLKLGGNKLGHTLPLRFSPVIDGIQ